MRRLGLPLSAAALLMAALSAVSTRAEPSASEPRAPQPSASEARAPQPSASQPSAAGSRVSQPEAPDPSARVVPLAVWVATSEGAPVVDEAWIALQLEWANRIFAPFQVRFAPVQRRPLPAGQGRLETRADRDALAAHRHPDAIHVFFVEHLRDVDEPERMRMGVHWRQRSRREVHYVVVSRTAAPTVLAHELGHFFGNPHSDVTNNIMSYDRDGSVEPFFDQAQGRRIEASLGRFVRTGELRLR